MAQQLASALEADLLKLKTGSKTVAWWLSNVGAEHPLSLAELSSTYKREFMRSLPGRTRKLPPSEIRRELERIQKAFVELSRLLGPDLSPQARRSFLAFGKAHVTRKWIRPNLVSSLEHVGSESRYWELIQMATLMETLPLPRPKAQTHSWLIRVIATWLHLAGKPKAHVLPIAKTIHHWASKEKIGQDWGNEFLDRYWPCGPSDPGGWLADSTS